MDNINQLTALEIDDICKELRDNIIKKYPHYSSHINFIYYYGCRIGELFGYRIAYEPLAGKVLIYPQKKNNTRILPVIHQDTQKWIEEINLTQENTYLNKRNLQRIIENENPIRNLKCGSKKIGSHLFRHNWVKKKVAEGYQFATIDNMMGYTGQTVANTYAVSVIDY